jgi:hypothetical protein
VGNELLINFVIVSEQQIAKTTWNVFSASGAFSVGIEVTYDKVVVGGVIRLDCVTSEAGAAAAEEEEEEDKEDMWFEWRFLRDGEVRASVVGRNATYLKRNVSLEDSGTYTCIAMSGKGWEAIKHSITVEVVESSSQTAASQNKKDKTNVIVGLVASLAVFVTVVGIFVYIKQSERCRPMQKYLVR